ncbi:MAG TPA: hypothetical protein VFE19_05715 [Jatrophihabitantaceae bacterium]|nr:hypothetical protein [Jatrophihabitantaceae bacterium]
MTDGAIADPAGSLDSDGVEYNFVGSAVVAALAGIALAWLARSGALSLLVGVAAAQALVAFVYILGLRIPGRIGAIVIAALASAAADVTVSVWPHARLGTLLAVFGLAMPALFVHQLFRGTARVRVIESLGGVAILVLAEVSLPALMQLRHEFIGGNLGGDVTFGVIVVAAGALVVGFLVDLVFAAPRFDEDVPRGLIAVIGSTAIGAALGQLTLRSSSEFVNGRAVFVGAALGAVVALFAVATALVEHGARLAESGFARRGRPVIGVLLPMSLLAPVAFLLCLAVRA